jgi:hypothetical protein
MKYCPTLIRVISISITIGFLGLNDVPAQTLGQNNPKPRQVNPKPQTPSSPVSKSEVSSIFRKIDQAVSKSITLSKAVAASQKPRTGVASRSEIVAEFHRVYLLCKPKFKYTANPGMTEPSLLTISEQDPSRKMIENLITWGFIGRYDPIATSKTQGMLPEDFGFAVAQFLGRLCELTHTPSSKFSPTMMRTDG